MGWFVAAIKPFIYVWGALKLIDDLALLIRLGRLGVATVPFPGKTEQNMCGVCDDVVGGFIVGKDGISAIPCPAACLGMTRCIDMCEKVKVASEETSEFPCVALGYCDPEVSGYISSSDIDCKGGAFFSCKPKQYCRRKRDKWKMTCQLKPGIGRWNGMKHLASTHTAALAAGLSSQRYCSEPGAGKYCIAKPKGFGLVAEWVGYCISLFVGGYKSIAAIETPGGNDDRQWLTFWVISTLLLFFERIFLRVLLSNVPLYYECKLAVLIWLIWRSGAEILYRRLRRVLGRIMRTRSFVWSEEAMAKTGIGLMQETGGAVVEKQLSRISKGQIKRVASDFKPNKYWEFDKKAYGSELDATEQLFYLSKYLISAEGSKEMENSKDISETDKVLMIERAAEVVSFQPRYLVLTLLGSIDGPRGELPPMDSNGLADGYFICHLVPPSGMPYPSKGVKSSTAYATLTPQWNQQLELQLKGGKVDSDGFYHCDDVKSTQLHLCLLDADVGRWSWMYYIFSSLIVAWVILTLAAYVEGATDNLTRKQTYFAMGIAAFILTGYAIGYVMAVRNRSDDKVIGFCTVPLGILLDQKEHTLILTLHPEEAGTKTNSTGGYGVVRVKMFLSEN
eukprot:scaffold3515_cov126-Cylindrotheca_fusiformis.AAC.9